jgi:Flp pilus assembly protein TadG
MLSRRIKKRCNMGVHFQASRRLRLAHRRLRSRARNERGSALVEFALVLPLIMLLTTGIFAFGFALNSYLSLTNAVTIGAQLAADTRGSTTIEDPCASTATAIQTAAPWLTPGGISYSITFENSAGTQTHAPYTGTGAGKVTCSGVNTTGTTMQQGGAVVVNAKYPCTLAGYGFNLPCNLTAQVTEMIQ